MDRFFIQSVFWSNHEPGSCCNAVKKAVLMTYHLAYNLQKWFAGLAFSMLSLTCFRFDALLSFIFNQPTERNSQIIMSHL